MALGVGVGVGLQFLDTVSAAAALPGSVDANGWSTTLTAAPSGDAVPYDSELYYVTRQGFDSSGAATTHSDAIRVMKRTRVPATTGLSTNQAALEHFIYANDNLVGATNNSTRAYEKPYACWETIPDLVATGSTYTVRLAVEHRWGRNGTPVAAVTFSATDGTNTVTQTVSAVTTVTYTASGLRASLYEWAIPTTSLDDGRVTVNATIYPHVGTAFNTATDAASYPSPNLCPLRFTNNQGGTAAVWYASVHTTAGGSPAASTNSATADANPFNTLAGAEAALQAAKADDDDICIIRMIDSGTFTLSGLSSFTVGDHPLFIEATSGNSPTVNDGGSTKTNNLPDKSHWSGDITFDRTITGGSVVLFDSSGNNLNHRHTFDGCTFNDSGGSTSTAYFYRVGIVQMNNCTISDIHVLRNFGTNTFAVKTVGCTGKGAVQNAVYNSIGTKCLEDARWEFRTALGNNPQAVGPMVFFCFLNSDNGSEIAIANAATGDRGYCISNVIFESNDSSSTNLISAHADSNVNQADNALLRNLTIVGRRLNYGYQDTGTAEVIKDFVMIGVATTKRNTKGDLFPTANANRIGNWPVIFNVSHRGNMAIAGGSDNNAAGAGSWVGEFNHPNDRNGTNGSPLTGLWTDDQSGSGGSGDGDYTPLAGAVMATLDAKSVAFPIDMNGTSVPTDGTAVSGALQKL